MTDAPLIPIVFPSIYKVGTPPTNVPLPKALALCTPDTKAALVGLAADVAAAGGLLRLSDLFRSHDMQFQAHLDFTSGKKKAFSPPPGGSMHEAGRAFDLDLDALGMKLADFWALAKARGVVPIVGQPDTTLSESWHFECRGSFELVRSHYKAGKGNNMEAAKAMAAAAIAAAGLPLDDFAGKLEAVRLQSALIRLGTDPGNIDGTPGPNTAKAAKAAKIAPGTVAEQLAEAEAKLQKLFPGEWFDKLGSPDNALLAA